MKLLFATREDSKIQLKIDPDLSGMLDVNCSTNPFELDKGKIVTCNFEAGKGVIEDEGAQRVFYSLNEVNNFVGAERRLPLLGLYNCRDLGGYQTKTGKLTKWGMFYRSDAPGHLEESDVAYLKSMHLGSVVDIRSPEECKANPDVYLGEQQHYNFDPVARIAKKASEPPKPNFNKDQAKVEKLEKIAQTVEGQEQLIYRQKEMVNQMRDLVLSENARRAYENFMKVLMTKQVPCFFHCQGGKDRTGWAAAIILGLLDVSKETIFQDYLLTEKFNYPRNQFRMSIYKQYTSNKFVLDYLASLQKTSYEYLESGFEALQERYGNMENYAREALMFSNQDLSDFREMYLY